MTEYNQKNTLLFTLEYPPFKGGVANVYGNIVKYWSFYARTADDEDNNIFVLTGKKLLKPHWLLSCFYLWHAVKKNKIKTVLVGHILPLGTVAYLLQKISKFDYIVILHGMDLAYAIKTSRKKKMAGKILKNAEKIICMNRRVAEIAKDFVDGDKVVVVNPGVAIKKQENNKIKKQLIEKYNLENKKILLQVGRLVERKGVDKVLEAMQTVSREHSDLVYVIIGRGEMEQNFKFQIANFKLQKNVILITDADDDAVNTWYELCDIFIMPARERDGDFEGFGVVYLEANARGKPVIAGDSGGVGDAVKDGVNGLLVNPESTEEIKNAIIKLYKDEGLCKRLGEQGREWVKNFEWEGQVKKIKEAVES